MTQHASELVTDVKVSTIKLSEALGFDIYAADFAIRDNVPFAIDFTDGVPDFDENSLRSWQFDWVVQAVADLVIEKALQRS